MNHLVWKLQLMANEYTNQFQHSPRHGRLVELLTVAKSARAAVRNAREAHLRVKGAKIFNLTIRRRWTQTILLLKCSSPRLSIGRQSIAALHVLLIQTFFMFAS